MNFANPNSSIILAPAGSGAETVRWTLPTGTPMLGSVPVVSDIQSPELIFSWISPVSTQGNYLSQNSFIGSTNLAPLRFSTNNTERMFISPFGNIGVNTSQPNSTLDVRSGSALLPAPNSEINDTLLAQSQYTFYVDETNNKLKIKVKKSTGEVLQFGAPTIIKKSIYFDVPPIANTMWTYDGIFTVEGAEPGNTVIVNPGAVSSANGSGVVISWATISAVNTVTVRFRQTAQNTSTNNLDAMNWIFTIIK